MNHVLNKGNYDKIIINGFSLGGNLTLKFAGEKTDLPKEVKLAIAVSTPVDLEGCMHQPVSYTHLDVYKRQTFNR